MKKLIRLLPGFILLVQTSLSAQNWLPFNTGRTYQYKDVGGIQFYTMQVDSISNKTATNVFYFDQKGINQYPSFFGGFFGHKMLLSPKGDMAKFVVTHFPYYYSPRNAVDTLYIKLKAKVGSTWSFSDSGNVTVSLKKKGLQEVFPGEMDSVQVFVTSLHDSLVLSKKYGLIKAKCFDQNLGAFVVQLDAIKELNKGVFLPDLRRMYDFQPGDIFIKKQIYSACVPYPYGGVSYYGDTILSRRTNAKGDTIWYEVNPSSPELMTITALSVTNGGDIPHIVINPLTTQKSVMGIIRTDLYLDSLNDLMKGFESDDAHKYVAGLGGVYYYHIDYALCGGPFDMITTSQLICWKTSTSESPNFDQCISTALGVDNESFSSTINIYPNPAQNSLSIELSNASNVMDIAIYDGLGKKAMSTISSSSKTTLDVSVLPAGLYSTIVRVNGKNYYQKFVKE